MKRLSLSKPFLVLVFMIALGILTLFAEGAAATGTTPDESSSIDFDYEVINGTEVRITGYTGAGGSVSFPNAINGLPVTEIWYSTLLQLNGITSVAIPANVRLIKETGVSAVWDCVSYSVSSDNLHYKSVDGVLFTIDGKKLMAYPRMKPGSSYTIPAEVTRVADFAFQSSEYLSEIILPEGLTSVGVVAFNGCQSTINIPSTIQKIGQGAFSGCAFTQVNLPSGVTSIGIGAFSHGNNLTHVNIPDNNQFYKSLGGMLYSHDGTLLHTYPSGRPENQFTVPDGVKTIGEDAFAGALYLGALTLPNSVTTVEAGAFNGSDLNSIHLPNSITSIGAGAFGYTQLTAIDLPDQIRNIPVNTFNSCRNLSSVTIPAGVVSIEYGAFQNCVSLQQAHIPASVTSIEENVFSGCDNLTLYILKGSAAHSYAVANAIPFEFVGEVVPVTGISMETSLTLPIGGTHQLSPVIVPESASDKTLIWTSSDLSVVQVSSVGLVTAIGDGTATISASAQDGSGVHASAEVTVKKLAYDMSGTKWDYTAPFTYDATEKTVQVTNLPDGVTIASYAGNTGTIAGSYTAGVTLNYDAAKYDPPTLADLSWVINKATYNMSGTTWNYNGPFTYDGAEKTVRVIGLPAGVTVASYTENKGTSVGNYAATVTLAYDTANFEQPVLAPLAWVIAESTIEEPLPGDSNGDTAIDIVDLVCIIDFIVSDTVPASLANADANRDGTVDIVDLVWIIDQIVGE
ncbi:MAG: leucine-rich repeat protein [Christensenellales bacterium]